ncbi:MAG: TonB-dependent receptor plug domain-containing protein [Pusillimonas sp.]
MKNHARYKARAARASAAMGMLSISIALAFGMATPEARAQSAAVQISLPAQPLGQALLQLGRQTSLQIFYPQDLVHGLEAPAISGNLTPEQALRQLLQGTGIEYSRQGDSVILSRREAQETAQLAPVTVTGSLPGALPPAYAGGQVARGGRLGMLGNVDVMDTPFNITNYTSQLIEDQQAETVLDVLKNEPSVRQSAPAGNPAEASFRIRGFGLSSGSVTFDGLHGMAPASGDLSTEFAERVEVLKGPSALLYGMSPSGAVGGAINLVPKRAGDAPLTRLTLGLESKTLWRTQVDTGRRFGANNEWGLRFNGRYKDGDKYIDDARNGGNLGALALDYRGERSRLTLDAYRMREKQRGGGTIAIFRLDSGLNSVPAAPDARTNMYPGAPESKETTQAVTIDLIANVLSNDSRFKVVSSPSIRMTSGVSGTFSVGQDVPVLGSVSYDGNGNAVQSVEYRSSGVIFKVLPNVYERKVVLDINQELSNFVRTETGVDGSPTLTKRELNTSVSVADNEVIVLGGLAEFKDNNGRSGFSFLPEFMRWNTSSKQRSEIVLVVQVQRL